MRSGLARACSSRLPPDAREDAWWIAFFRAARGQGHRADVEKTVARDAERPCGRALLRLKADLAVRSDGRVDRPVVVENARIGAAPSLTRCDEPVVVRNESADQRHARTRHRAVDSE